MKIAILDKVVRENIALFQHLVQRFLHTRKLQYLTAEKAYKAYLNCKTGQIKFADLENGSTPDSDWKQIMIKLHPIQNEEGVFEVIALENPNQFPLNDLKKEAYMRLARTIRVLNQLAFDPHQKNSLNSVLKRIAELTFEFTELEEGQKNLVHEAWHMVDRIGAERLLKKAPVGTYLFRKDVFAQMLEEQLNKETAEPIVCITLTYKDKEEKISDKTLVYKNDKWLFYNDDTTLNGKTFPTVKALLSTMNVLKTPLTN